MKAMLLTTPTIVVMSKQDYATRGDMNFVRAEGEVRSLGVEPLDCGHFNLSEKRDELNISYKALQVRSSKSEGVVSNVGILCFGLASFFVSGIQESCVLRVCSMFISCLCCYSRLLTLTTPFRYLTHNTRFQCR